MKWLTRERVRIDRAACAWLIKRFIDPDAEFCFAAPTEAAEKARELGATHSNFVNPNGLPTPDQYSTARDLAIIARAAYANPTIRSIVSSMP